MTNTTTSTTPSTARRRIITRRVLRQSTIRRRALASLRAAFAELLSTLDEAQEITL